jgi:hypothetical protein
MFKWVLFFCGLFNDVLYYISVKMHMLLFLWLLKNGFVHLKLRINVFIFCDHIGPSDVLIDPRYFPNLKEGCLVS